MMKSEINTPKGRILVVDDDDLTRVLLTTNLQEGGYSVESAEDGQYALQLLREKPFDTVLLDLLMPIMDGFQVLSEMKNDSALRRIPVIIITSMDDYESIVRCIEMGATDYLTKPFDPVLLHARLKASLASIHEERMAILREQFAQVRAAQEDERQRITQELHDGLGPSMASLNIRLRTVAKRLEKENHPLASELNELAEQVQANILDIRRLIQDLRPAVLDELGLVPALREHLSCCAEEYHLQIEFTANLPERLPTPVETALFRIVQEAINNVNKHAQANQVQVSLHRELKYVKLRIADDGAGFNIHSPRSVKQIGLWSMCERVEQLGGQFEVSSAPGSGTIVTTLVPY